MDSRSLRTFWAVRPPDAVVEAAAGLVHALKSPCEKLGLEVRWVELNTLHITLQFLGQVPEQAILPMVARVKSGLAQTSIPSPRIYLKDLAAFPNLLRPSVLYVGVHGEAQSGDGLFSLKSSLEDWLAELGYPREARAFTPHLTLGRVRPGHAVVGRQLLELYANHGNERLGEPFPVNELVLYESRPRKTADGVEYVPLQQLPLSGL